MDNRLKGCNLVTMTSSKYQPKSKPLAYRPLAPSVTCGDSSLPEGAMGSVPLHIGLLLLGKCLLWNPSVTPPACQLPLAREPFCARYRSMCDTGLFPAFNRQRGNEAPQKTQTKTGAGAKTQHPSQSEGSIPDGSTRGILKGGAIRAGASCSPLEPASLLTFLPEQESKAPLASACRKPIGEETQRL